MHLPGFTPATFRRIEEGGQDGRAVFLNLILTHPSNPHLRTRLDNLLVRMPADDQAILEFVLLEVDRAYGSVLTD